MIDTVFKSVHPCIVSLSFDNKGGPSVRHKEHWECDINFTVEPFISLWFTFHKIQPKLNENFKAKKNLNIPKKCPYHRVWQK